MFPKEIIEILEKYQENNSGLLISINEDLSDIIEKLYSVNQSLAEQIKNLVLDKDTDNNVDEVINDSKILRNYIKSIKLLNISNNPSDNKPTEASEGLTPIFAKKVYPYIVSDDICPSCNIKLINHTIFYQRNINNELVNETVLWYKCPSCNRVFALDYEIEDFDFKNTNIVCNNEYSGKTQFDDAIVVFNINKCSKHNHSIEDIKCELPIVTYNGEIIYQIVPIILCKTCKRYIMLKSVYDSLNGIPLCTIIDETYKDTFSENEFYYGEGNGSKLKQYGYNVNCNDKLTIEQRHTILRTLLLAKYITKSEIYSILDTNIKRGSNRTESKRDWSNAVAKWQSDKKYVENLNLDEEIKRVNINKLILKYIIRQN